MCQKGPASANMQIGQY